MNRYEVGKEYFLKAMVAEKDLDGQYPLRVVVPVDTPLKSEYTSIRMANVPGILLTAEEVASIQNRDIVNLERAVEELRVENESLRKKIDKHETTIEERTIECNKWEGMYNKASQRCDELQKTCEEDTTVAIDLANQRDNLKRKYETALKDLAQKDEACEKLKRRWDDALKDKVDLQKAVEGLNKEIDGYRETIRKMSAVIGFLCGTGEVNNG